ncbi:MAG: TRAP transporter small permease subunit [Spirochaetes bacterium]|nr:TRAP transporter small permease subunit [Spirochaetota bacterium]
MKKLFYIVRDIFEIYVPAVAFLAMFISFILQVFFRYAINMPLTWTQDIIVIGFVWTVLFGACYTMRAGRHVKFTMIYDKLGPKGAAISRFAGDLIIVVAFVILIVPSWKYSIFLYFQKTPVFRVNYTYVFIPFVYLILSVIGYSVKEMLEDIQILRGKLADSPDHLMGVTK